MEDEMPLVPEMSDEEKQILADLEREPMTFPGRTPPKDLSLDKAAEDMRQSMGWTGEQLQQWMSKYRK